MMNSITLDNQYKTPAPYKDLQEEFPSLKQKSDEIGKMINGLYRKLKP